VQNPRSERRKKTTKGKMSVKSGSRSRLEDQGDFLQKDKTKSSRQEKPGKNCKKLGTSTQRFPSHEGPFCFLVQGNGRTNFH